MDYEDLLPFKNEIDILFVSESFRVEFGELTPFAAAEENLIRESVAKLINPELAGRVEFTAAIKCPGVKEDDINTDSRNICRQHIEKTINLLKPKLVFVCGSLALTMVTKKKGILEKRGKVIKFTCEDGTEIPVIPIFHPTQVLMEPKNQYLFDLDILNGIQRHLTKKHVKTDFEFTLLDTPESLDILTQLPYDVAIDTETTGLDFVKDHIQTFALSFNTPDGIRTFAIPFNHKEFDSTELRPKAVKVLKQICRNPNIRKIFHNAKFDIRMMFKEGIVEYNNVYDTKLLQHLDNENLPKSLSDLVDYYFASEKEIAV